MLNIGRILTQDRLLRATTGMNRKAFESLLEKFEQVYCGEADKREKPRSRKRGGGRKARLQSIKEKLFYILFYFKCYPTFDLAAVLFDFDRSQANRWVHRLQPILERVLGEVASPRTVLIPSFDFSGSRLASLLSITTMSLSSVDNSVATLPPIEPPPSMIIFKSNFP